MTDELIKRLRFDANDVRNHHSSTIANRITEAADLIEQQAAKIAGLATDLERTRNERNAAHVTARREIHKEHRDYIAKLEAKIAALAKRPVCVDCGDSIMAHDPGTCGTCHAVKYAALPGKAAMEEMRDKWKIVDGDCREGDDGLLTYHVDAFDEGYRAALAAPVAPAVDAQPVALAKQDTHSNG